MENLGYLTVLLAFCLTVYALLAALAGKWRGNAFLELSAQRAVTAAWIMVTSAAGILLWAIFTDDFRFSYVASSSNADMEALYKLTALWGGQEGSLLFWSWILSTYSFIAVYTARRKHHEIISYVVAIMMAVQTFFLMLITFLVSPFQVIMSGPQITPVADGTGLNPLLQHPVMAIHPPMLYLGYVGFVVPFAFAMASLIAKQPGERWIHTTRVWTMVTWLFQSCGVLLGAYWSYDVLGWGGYWAWDPVENASFLPWLTATAFLHSVMMQEKKGMMKVWNVVLVAATFLLCLFGTMITRSGMVSSVHAFAQSPIGSYFLWFLTGATALSVFLILSRLDFLRSENEMDSVVSRESSFLFNNVILLASCFAVLWGTLFPVISEAFTNEKISVGAPFFNKVNIPMGLLLLFLTGVGPLFAWRRTSVDSLRRNFQWPATASLVLGGVLMTLGMRHFYALVCFVLCAFVGITILAEFYRGARVIQSKQPMWLGGAMMELTHRNTRRYGGYLVHMGVVFMFIGFAGAAFNLETQAEMNEGDVLPIGAYELRLKSVSQDSNAVYASGIAEIDLYKKGELIETMKPERRLYHASGQGVGIVSIRTGLYEDVYIVFAGLATDGQNPVIQGYIKPLVSWIWIGGWTLVFGTLVALIPSKIKRIQAKTHIIGTVKRQNEVFAK